MSTEHAGIDERKLALGALKAVAAMAPLAAGIAWWSVSGAAAVSAVVGLVFVLVLFGASAMLLGWVARNNQVAMLPLLVGGALARLLLYAAALVALAQFSWVHRPSLALATAAAIAVTLAYELRLLHDTPRLFWVEPEAAGSATGSSATSNATRSR